jgi:hypothetical protein
MYTADMKSQLIFRGMPKSNGVYGPAVVRHTDLSDNMPTAHGRMSLQKEPARKRLFSLSTVFIMLDCDGTC